VAIGMNEGFVSRRNIVKDWISVVTLRQFQRLFFLAILYLITSQGRF